HVKAILSQDDEGQALESYLERSREIRNKLPYLTGQIKNN
ncbi:MAG: prephenate dehydrogenase/arogenate dehydrogenase family protein, partial [Veillonella sp.]|nr:prephenate dehydrogenase/arogenate dehydrogenase family protein [Veillonella sp.]